MTQPFIWGEPEKAFLRRFMDGVDLAVSSELQAGQRLLEDNLTFVLGRLLDDASTFQRLLKYPSEELNRDLSSCSSGHQVTVRFETHEHTKAYEGTVSFADLGIVVHREHSVFGQADTKAVLVQSKKLYPDQHGYSLSSRYGGFDLEQYRNLVRLARTLDPLGVAYFFYNPRLEAFADGEGDVVTALEANLCSPGYREMVLRQVHPRVRYLLDTWRRAHPWAIGADGAHSGQPEAMRDIRREVIERRPGIRVMDVDAVGGLIAGDNRKNPVFSLESCYRHVYAGGWVGEPGAVPFVTFSEYIVDMLLSCTHGSRDDAIIQMARGVPLDAAEAESNDIDDATRVAARHTLTIVVRSTLPEREAIVVAD